MAFLLKELLSSCNPAKPLPRISQSQTIERIAMHMTVTELRQLVRRCCCLLLLFLLNCLQDIFRRTRSWAC